MRYSQSFRSRCTWAVLAAALGWSWPCLADSPVKLAIETPRRAFYRGEEILLVINCTNGGKEPIRKATLAATIGGYINASAEIQEIPPGGQQVRSFRLASGALKSGRYELKVTLAGKPGALATLTEPIGIGRRPNPDRLMVWLWGGGGNQWYLDHGFTTWSGPYGARGQRQYTPADRRNLDQALLAGAAVGIQANGGLRDIDPTQIHDPDAINLAVRKGHEKKVANPFHPEVARRQNRANRRLMEFVRDYPQVKTAFFNTEIVDVLGNNRNKAGVQLMKDLLGFSEKDIGKPKFVAPGVIADDDRRYLFHKYLYKHGNGLALANQRTADMIHRYRPDIITINDPYRYTSVLDMFPGLDVISTWTYTNPDPKLMLYIETLRAACKPTGQTPLQTVTMLNYPGSIAPTKEWMLMGPGRVTVTSWINLSRAPKIIGYYYSSACPPPGKPGDFRVPYETSAKIKKLAEKVFKPYGPMITNLQVEPRRIAVLSSASSIVHRKSPSLPGYPNMQIYHFYTVMAMAHLQADVVFDETIERYGLDDYDVLVLAKCDTLTKSVYDEILRFRQRGGIVIADQYLRAKVPGAIRFDFDFTYRKKVSANAIVKNKMYAKWDDHLDPDSAELKTVKGVTALNDQKIMESYAARLKRELAGKVDPPVDCDSPTVLLNMLEKDGVKYLVVINDKRTYDQRVGKYKAVLGKLLPQTVTITLNEWQRPDLYAYDMLERQALDVKKAGGRYRFTVGLDELGGKIIALYPRKLGKIRINVPPRMKRGIPYDLTVELQDVRGRPLGGLQPVEVVIASPKGQQNEFSGYYCAANGMLHIAFTPAVNDSAGKWRIRALDLTAGLKAEASFEVGH